MLIDTRKVQVSSEKEEEEEEDNILLYKKKGRSLPKRQLRGGFSDDIPIP